MKRVILYLLIVLLFSSHDMFLKLDQYFLRPNTDYVIELFNGTFDRSENVITRDRMSDVSTVVNGKRKVIDTAQWYEKNNTTYLRFATDAPGTYVTGVSTTAKSFEQSADDFNGYLEHDGVLDMLELRKKNGTFNDSAVELYSKHVKTIFQVGERLTDDYKTELGYPIEFILLENPYEVHSGHNLPVKLLFNQKPLPNQLVYVGSETKSHTHDGTTHSHDGENDHSHDNLLKLRTDEKGLLSVPISTAGVWYLKTIHIAEVDKEGLTHESNWATVTFGVGDGHSNEHDHDEGIPTYIYVIISLLLIVILYLLFDKKR